ncbi:MAG: hypothetical protein P4M08_08610 [Oligoflexia bacterium]|nr:hypothetical protein [Oligoflexia bacterium]
MNRNSGFLTFSLIIVLNLGLNLGLTACSGGNSSVRSGGSATASPPSSNGTTSSANINAKGWSEVIVHANYAKTLLDFTGHFSTDRNACGQDANGAIELANWNAMTDAINQAVTAKQNPSEDQKICPTQPDSAKMDGDMEIVLDSGTQMKIFENYGPGQVCSQIADAQLAQRLYDAINQLVVLADKTDCQNGWGR